MSEQYQLFETPPKSQKERILFRLRYAGERGICIEELPPDLSYTARNRVSELRKAGYTIEGVTCHLHRHKSAIQRYILTKEPHDPAR